MKCLCYCFHKKKALNIIEYELKINIKICIQKQGDSDVHDVMRVCWNAVESGLMLDWCTKVLS